MYSCCLLYSSDCAGDISTLFLKYLKDKSVDEEMEDKKGEKESKPLEKEIDKDYLPTYSWIDFSLLSFQKALKYNSIFVLKKNTFFEITTPPPELS
jgi:hypothetical protein